MREYARSWERENAEKEGYLESQSRKIKVAARNETEKKKKWMRRGEHFRERRANFH